MTDKVKSERDWQAEADADTMARYNEIMADAARKDRAIKAAKKQVNDLMTRINKMKKVSNTKSSK